MDDERARELLNMSETEASNLSREEWYDRVRLIRQKIGEEMFSRIKLSNHSYSGEKNSNCSQLWGPGHPAYDSLHGEKRQKKPNALIRGKDIIKWVPR